MSVKDHLFTVDDVLLLFFLIQRSLLLIICFGKYINVLCISQFYILWYVLIDCTAKESITFLSSIFGYPYFSMKHALFSLQQMHVFVAFAGTLVPNTPLDQDRK